MPKPTKITYTSGVLCGAAPVLDKPGWEELYHYGIETGALGLKYDRIKHTKQGAELGHKVLERMRSECTSWLAMKPPELPGAAKQCINIEGMLFQLGYDKHAIKAAENETDTMIDLCACSWHAELRGFVKYNREGRSMLPCCASCGKYIQQKRMFCGKCKTAAYCDEDCQKKHWAVHREQCGAEACAACGKIPEKPMKCGRCKSVTYCSKEHQTRHWKQEHKKECKVCN